MQLLDEHTLFLIFHYAFLTSLCGSSKPSGSEDSCATRFVVRSSSEGTVFKCIVKWRGVWVGWCAEVVHMHDVIVVRLYIIQLDDFN